MLQLHPTEKFKEIEITKILKFRYAISNFGRLISFTKDFEDGNVVRGSLINGYRIFRYKVRIDTDKVTYKHFLYYRLVAEYFLTKPSEDHTCVLHLNRDRSSDHVSNLKWATKEEMYEHWRLSPFVIEAKKRLGNPNIRSKTKKLTVAKVMLLKKMLLTPGARKTRMKIIAQQFGISEMQLYRIKTGENWASVKV